ncbi:MAG: PAS domain-containing sensor histidine kinase [Syntrophales bacterium]
MAIKVLPTYFAPAERSADVAIKKDADRFGKERFFANIVNFVPDIVLILDKNRQVVFANRALMDFLRIYDLEAVLGKRTGEILHCKHADETEGGCGTTEFCRYCGGANAILNSQKGDPSVEECRILVKGNTSDDALDLRVYATPFLHHGEQFTCFAAVNIADEKHKLFMERIFLHDIMNTATALRGFSDLIKQGAVDAEMEKDFMQRISFLSGRIIDEINAHRQLIAAEQNTLVITKKALNSCDFISGLYASYNRADILDGRNIEIDESAQPVPFSSDETLLSRVVGNMIKNAIEASVPGETVTIGCYAQGGHIHFWVNNPTYMPENIRLQVFNRSFSTKGSGRGLGTYSMKYLTEKYLQGRVSFVSDEKTGTTFTAAYPLDLH